MAVYEVLQPAFIGMQVVEKGQQVTVADDVIPGPFMKPIDKPAIKAFQAFAAAGYVAPQRPMDDMALTQFETFDIKELGHGA